MSSNREEMQPKAMDTSIKVALIGAAATLAAALITAYISCQQQPPVGQEKRRRAAGPTSAEQKDMYYDLSLGLRDDL